MAAHTDTQGAFKDRNITEFLPEDADIRDLIEDIRTSIDPELKSAASKLNKAKRAVASAVPNISDEDGPVRFIVEDPDTEDVFCIEVKTQPRDGHVVEPGVTYRRVVRRMEP